MRITTLVFLFVFLSFMYLGNIMLDKDIESGELRDITNLTNTFQWNESRIDNITYVNHTRANNILAKTINYYGYIFMEISKGSLEFGYNQGHKYNVGFIFKIIYIYFWILIITTLFFPVLILAYLIYLLVKWINEKRKSK